MADLEDEIDYEMDVFINQNLSDDLYIIQYPLRSTWNPYPNEGKIQFKDHHQFLKMTFDVPKTELQRQEEREFGNNENQTMSLESTVQPMGATYAIGILSNGQLHLNPLKARGSTTTEDVKEEGPIDIEKKEKEKEKEEKTGKVTGGGILQMRPSFTHLNLAPITGEEDMKDMKDGAPVAITKVAVKYQTKKQERIHNFQKNSYANKQKEFDEEPFIPLKYSHPDRSFEPYEKIKQLVWPHAESEKIDPITLSRSEYLDILVGEAAQPITKSFPYGICSRQKRESLPLKAQVNQLLRSALLLPYTTIKKLISVECTDEELISILEQFAVVIDGIWIVKSSHCSDIKGNPGLIGARNLMLVELFKNPSGIFQMDVTEKTNCFYEDTTRLFLSLCDYEYLAEPEPPTTIAPHIPRRKRWNLKVQREYSFAVLHEDVANRAEKQWQQMDRELQILFKKSDIPILDLFFGETFAQYGVCNLTFLRAQMAKFIENGHPSLAKISDTQFRKKLAEITNQLHSAYYLKVHPNIALNKYRDVILSVFKDKKSPKITKRDVLKASAEQLDAPIPEDIYRAIMNELAYSSKGSWIFLTGHGRIG